MYNSEIDAMESGQLPEYIIEQNLKKKLEEQQFRKNLFKEQENAENMSNTEYNQRLNRQQRREQRKKMKTI